MLSYRKGSPVRLGVRQEERRHRPFSRVWLRGSLAPSMNSASLVPSLAISFPIAGANLGSCDAYFLAGPISLIAPLLKSASVRVDPGEPINSIAHVEGSGPRKATRF